MQRVWARWTLPAIAAVFAGTLAAMLTTGPGLSAALVREAASTLGDLDRFVDVRADFRHLRLTGVAPDGTNVARLAAALAELPGVASVDNAVQVAALADPFVSTLTLRDGQIRLSGAMPEMSPDGIPTGVTNRAGLRSGGPATAAWSTQLAAAVELFAHLESGSAVLTDAGTTLVGTARSVRDYDALQLAGVSTSLAEDRLEILPPLEPAYAWQLGFDGRQVTIGGNAPTLAIVDSWRDASPEGVGVRTALTAASGAPAGFELTSTAMLQSLPAFASAMASLEDGHWRFAGVPKSVIDAERARKRLLPLGIALELARPIDLPYRVAALSTGGDILLAGSVPSAILLGELAERGFESGDLSISPGASPKLAAALDYGLNVLNLLGQGSLLVEDNAVTLNGTARDEAAFGRAQRVLAEGPPQGVRVRLAQVAPPVGAAGAVTFPQAERRPFTWSAVKEDDGAIRLLGAMPDEGTRTFLLLRAGPNAKDETEIAAGAPPTFIRAASAGLRALGLLTEGTLSFEGGAWSLSGTAANDDLLAAAKGALATAEPAPSAWGIEIAALPQPPTEPTPAPVAEAPAIVPPKLEVAPAAPQEPVEHPGAPAIAAPAAGPSEVATPGEAPVANAPAAEPIKPAVVPPAPVTEGAKAAEVEEPAPVEIAEPVEPAAKTEVANVPLVAPKPEILAPAPSPSTLAFLASKRADGLVTLTGDVPSEPARRYLNLVAGTKAIDEMKVAAADPADFMSSVNAGLRALMTLSEGELVLKDGKWALSGKALDTPSEDKARQLVAALPDARSWSLGIEGPPPFAVCSAALVAFDDRNPLLFRSGSAVLADQSRPALDELAGTLDRCPDAAVHVEGHTDADGPDDLNLALSVSRAEAVVDALIERGIDAERLYAIGYGESLPIAPNESQAGKQRNRRIVVTVVEETN